MTRRPPQRRSCLLAPLVVSAFVTGACGNGMSSRANADASAAGRDASMDVAAGNGGTGGADANVIDSSEVGGSGGALEAGGDALITDSSTEDGPVFEDAGACSAEWAEWPMPNSPGSGLPNPANYDTTSVPGVVIDQVTGLMWQQDVDANTFTWSDAKTYCSDLTLGGASDWRLPIEIELASLFTPPLMAPDPVSFPNAPSEPFWSASPLAGNNSFAWAAFFNWPSDGGVYSEPDPSAMFFAFLGETKRVRCVRGATTNVPPVHYTVANGTVTDHYTGLTWQQNVSVNSYGPLPGPAASYCSSLTLAGGGWRLPSLKELLTLVDFCAPQPGPTIDKAVFPNTPAEWLWSSSTSPGLTQFDWGVDFYSGTAHPAHWISGGCPVRCVR
jgi:Protein of unknown function (DUF1566)